MSAHSDSILTNTAIDRSRRRDDTRVMPTLLVVGSSGDGAPRPSERVVAFDEQLAIGRRTREMADADAHWVVRDDLVSRLHARITRAGDGWELSDLGSRNGTAVDGSHGQAGSRQAEGRVAHLPGQLRGGVPPGHRAAAGGPARRR